MYGGMHREFTEGLHAFPMCSPCISLCMGNAQVTHKECMGNAQGGVSVCILHAFPCTSLYIQIKMLLRMGNAYTQPCAFPMYSPCVPRWENLATPWGFPSLVFFFSMRRQQQLNIRQNSSIGWEFMTTVVTQSTSSPLEHSPTNQNV